VAAPNGILAGVLAQKSKHLQEIIRSYGSCLVAYSGGVDSVFLAKICHDLLGDKSLAVIADSPSLPRRELEEAVELGRAFSFPVRVIQTNEFDNPEYLANPTNRCYFCKHELFTGLVPIARSEGFSTIAYGENASDVGDFRPGATAAAEFAIRAPLKEAGLLKAEIRQLSAQLGLPTADKPQMACLSSRIPTGEAVTTAKLSMVEQAENVLRDLGFVNVRVRHHELPAAAAVAGAEPIPRALARIEVGSSELLRFADSATGDKIETRLRSLGYHHVTIDLKAYHRPGSS
jgi:uncharacterized protein